MSKAFDVGIDFQQVLAAISRQIYETPLAFLRENVQNAVDAIRIQALREKIPSKDDRYVIEIKVEGQECRIRDNGIGMSEDDLRQLFWTIGASGKRNEEARRAGCVGMFGIGGFANLGVCDKLTVISQTEGSPIGTSSWLSEEVIKAAGATIPQVQTEESSDAGPRGTLVIGRLRNRPNLNELEQYLRDFVRFAEERILFNGRLVSRTATASDPPDALKVMSTPDGNWEEGNLKIRGTLYQESGHTLVATVNALWIDGNEVRLAGRIRFENGPIDVFKRGFKLCATKVQTQIGISGPIDCDVLSPTAGRDSLDADSTALVGRIASCLERVAVEAVLESPELLAQHTRIFPYINSAGWFSRLGNLDVMLADGTETRLKDVHTKSKNGVSVFFGSQQKEALSQIMQARGHIVVLLPSDRSKRRAVQTFLETECAAKAFSDLVEIMEVYSDLDRFEQVFLSELEANVSWRYEIKDAVLTAAKVTEDIPVFVREGNSSRSIEIIVDVRHSEITKLRPLGISSLLYSLIAAFCQEYLGPTLRKHSPKFFGSGALNVDLLAKKRSELWILIKDDVQTISKQSERQVMRRSDVQTVRVAASTPETPSVGEQPVPRKAKLLKIEGDSTFAEILGYYIRLPDAAVKAFGDLIKECDSRGVVWAGNKIMFVASDRISSAFQFEIRLDNLIVTKNDAGQPCVEGARELIRPIQEMNEGLYFPIPDVLESVLVPTGDEEIRIEVSPGDWIDLKGANAWHAK
jgi:molecular chaperone HtpG